MALLNEYWDGIRWIQVHEEQGQVVRRDRQPARDTIMERNKRLAIESREAVRMDFAGLRPTANIPERDYDNLVRMNPDLESPDPDIKYKAWTKFLGCEGKVYVYNPPRLQKWNY